MSGKLITASFFFGVFGLVHSIASAATPATLPATRAAARPTTQQVRTLISALSSDDWQERQKAMGDLTALGPSIEGELRARLKENPDPQAMQAIEALLKQISEFGKIGPTLITLKLNSVSPADAAAALAKEAKIEYAPGTGNLWSDSPQKIDLNLDGVPLWQALLQFAAKTHVALNGFDHDGHILFVSLGKDASPPPTATAGPFLVMLSRIEVNVSKAKDFAGPKPINARNNAFQSPACRLYLFPFAEPKLQVIHWYIDSIDECVTDTGQSVNVEKRGGWPVSSGRIGKYSNETQLTFTAPPDGKKIARLKMNARFVLKRGSQKLEVNNILNVKNSTHLLGGFRVVIVDINKITNDHYAFEIEVYRDGHSEAEWALAQSLMDTYSCKLVDAAGEALSFRGGGGSSGPDKMTSHHDLACDRGGGVKVGEPVKLVWEVPWPTEQMIVPLEFRDIELPK